ncbi:MAG TPA: NAD-dependent epimerase/dehydratase family protein [Flavipsychrobacter sp.]|nr:NAD-dependent epimerase/dehydratase family protein [Flavipsychrobacter sp.]
MVLVTGASGFLGQHLVRYLSAKGCQVRALYHHHPPSKDLQGLPGITWMKFNLLDIYEVEEAMKDISDVYHCAAVVSFNPKRREEMLHFNSESTAHIVNQAIEQGIRKMVYISSVAALGRSDSKKIITEEEEWEESKHNSAYGMSKYMAEMEVWRGMGEGLNAVIVNPGIILGEGDWNDGSARLMKIVSKEFPFYTQGVTSWVDINDVITLLYMLMQSDVADERFILSEGNHAFKEVFTLMANALNKKPSAIKASGFMTELVWRFSMLKTRLFNAPATITKETARNAQSLSYYDNSKLLSFFPNYSYTPLSETINRMATVFVKEN